MMKDGKILKTDELTLQDFCDMQQLYKLLDNWSKSSGMSAVVVDNHGQRISQSFGLTELCRMVKESPMGDANCASKMKSSIEGFYICPMGFSDFAVPITLPNGQVLAKVLAGQALSMDQEEEAIVQNALKIGLDESSVRAALKNVKRKTAKEMKGSYELLKEMLNFYVEKNYSVWQTQNELSKAPAKKDRILSHITQLLYGYNLTVDLGSNAYTLITGTGMERTIKEYKQHGYVHELWDFHSEIIHPAYINRFKKLVDFEALKNDPQANGFIGSLEYPVLYSGDTEYEWHEINVFVDTDSDGNRVANVLGRDITEAHNAAEKNAQELQAAASKNQILSEITKMLYSYNLTLNLRTGKYSMIIGTGMTKFMDIFKSTDDYETAYTQKLPYLDPENVAQFAALASLDALRARSNSRGFIGSLDYGAIVDHGEEWHEINVFMGSNEKGEPIANILGRDITETHKRQKQRENQQKAAVARDQLLSGITKMLYSFNLTVNLESWHYSLITGTGELETVSIMQETDDYVLLFAKLFKFVAPEHRENYSKLISVKALKKMLHTSGYAGSVTCRVQINGIDQWQEVNLFMGTNEAGEPVANILGRDVTEAHNQAETMAQLEIANRASAAKSAFLFNMSHDIRTPMNAIIGFTDLLEQHLHDQELAKSYIGKIKTANDFLLSLINNVLEMARIESGMMKLEESVCDVYSFNDSFYSLFEPQLREKQLEHTRVEKVQHRKVICDAVKLREVFFNIYSNAVKYTPAGGRITMSVEELPWNKPGYSLYTTVIEDTGIGISEAFLPHVFEEFTREHSSTESKVHGTGLGMPIVKKLVDLMGGTIHVVSKLGEGTKITIQIPLRWAEEEAAVVPKAKVKAKELQFKGKRILLAEDNELNSEIATAILQGMGFAVELAEDGQKCVEMLKKAPAHYYDFILMDIQMPNMNGYEATKAIRELEDEVKSKIVILAVTANAFEEDRKNALQAGMNGHIAKPIKIDALSSTLAEFFD